MTATIKLTLPFSPSANRYWRSAPRKGLVPSAEAEAYKRLVAQVAHGTRPLVGDVRVAIEVYRPRRIGDLDNSQKVLFDALRGIAFLDDAQVASISAERRDDPARPRVEFIAEGERFATPAEVSAHAEKVAEANRKRRQTRRENELLKRAQGQAGFRLTPALFGRKP